MGRLWRAALVLSAVAAVVPLWVARFVPLLDLPEQVAVIATLRHWFEPAWHAQDVYALNIGKSQYVLYHLVGALLSFATGDAELANRLLLTAVGLSFPFSLRSLLRALDRDPRLALFAAPAFWSRPLVMGFLPYVASVPVVMWGLALAVRQAKAPARGRWVALALLGVAVFTLHGDAYVLFVLGAIGLRVAHGTGGVAPRLRASGRDLAWLAPSAVVAAAWAVYGTMGSGGTSLSASGAEVEYLPPAALLEQLPSWSHDIWMSHVDEGCAVALWGAFAVLTLQRRSPAFSWAAAVPLLCAAATYVALPYRVAAGGMLNVRLAVFVALFAPVVLDPSRGKVAAAALSVVLGAGLVNAGYAALQVHRMVDAELGDVERLLDRMPPGARVATLPFHLTSSFTHLTAWAYLGTYHRIRRGGVASFSFTELAHWPLHYRPEAAPPPKPIFWTLNPCTFRNETDGRYYDFVLTRGNVDPFRDAPPGPRWRKVDQERDFTLYAKVPGEESPPWTVPDGGPCESRRSLERAAELHVAPL